MARYSGERRAAMKVAYVLIQAFAVASAWICNTPCTASPSFSNEQDKKRTAHTHVCKSRPAAANQNTHTHDAEQIYVHVGQRTELKLFFHALETHKRSLLKSYKKKKRDERLAHSSRTRYTPHTPLTLIICCQRLPMQRVGECVHSTPPPRTWFRIAANYSNSV